VLTLHKRKAVKWAISKNVDIISMSFALLEKSPDLRAQVANANTNGIIMVCSTHDEGERVSEAWPASFGLDCIKVITACDEYGHLLRESSLPSAHYRLQGQNVWAGDIPFLDARESPTGSSVSTALAAGLSALILTCDRLANRDRPLAKTERCTRVEQFLNDMKSDAEKSNFVILEKFGSIDKSRGSGGISASNILSEKFFQPHNRVVELPLPPDSPTVHGNGL
jgi:hypothetical protein